MPKLRNSSNVELREWQKKLRGKVERLIEENQLVFLNAPTGSGKTLFSLLVGLETKGKVLYLVRTHNEYVPVFRDLRKIDNLKFSFLVGKPYACLFSNGDANTEDINSSLCEFRNAIVDINVDDYPNEFLKKLKERGIREGFCPYFSLYNDIGKADVVVLTYPYFFISRFRESLGLEFEDYLIVVDEAHNIERIGELEEKTLSQHLIDLALQQVKSEMVKGILQKIKSELGNLVFDVEGYIKAEKVPEITDEELDIMREEYESIRREMLKEKRIKRVHLGSIIRFYELYKNEKDFIPFIHKNKIVLKNIEPSSYLQILNDEGLSFLLMSGTLPPEDYIKIVWGISRKFTYINVEKEVRGKIVGDYECILATDVTTKFDIRSENMWKRYADYLLKVYYQAKSHILAIFPSYEIMQKVMKYVEVPKYLENEDTAIEEVYSLVEKFDKVIIGAVGRGKLAEGVELVKDGRSLLSDIVIVGIPYPPPDDYTKMIAKRISERLGSKEEEYLFKIPALIAIKQSIGRGIRSINDHVKVWLLDKRFDSLWWKKNLNCLNPKKTRL